MKAETVGAQEGAYNRKSSELEGELRQQLCNWKELNVLFSVLL